VDAEFGIREIREIDESVNRLRGKDTEEVSIFHGRDLFSYCAARLASGIIDFQGVGPSYPTKEIVRHPIRQPESTEGGIRGIFEINDPNFGNLWTNISLSRFREAGFAFGDRIHLRICENGEERFNRTLLFEKSFGFAPKGEPMIYNNELMKVSLAVSQGSFSDAFDIGYGPGWSVEFRKQGHMKR
jgi:S-adenosylmethionine hydrolase